MPLLSNHMKKRRPLRFKHPFIHQMFEINTYAVMAFLPYPVFEKYGSGLVEIFEIDGDESGSICTG